LHELAHNADIRIMPRWFHHPDLPSRRGAAIHLDRFGSEADGSDKAVHALNAQFLIQELARRVQEEARRVQDRQARIMIVCTIAITFMTLVLVWRN
jgi:hypothetical protein